MAERRVLHVLPHRGAGGERYIDLLEAMDGFRFERFALTEGRGKVEALRGAARARRRAAGFDLVHVHGDSAAILCLPVLRRQPGVITFHGLHLLRRTSGVFHSLVAAQLRRAIRRSRAAICISESEHADVLALMGGALGERAVRIDNGIPAPAPAPRPRAEVRAELGLAEHELGVLYAGQLESRKGVLDLLEALETARSDGAALTGLIAGDGPLRAEIEGRAAAMGARVLGERDDVESLLTAADAFVMPSAREGLSLAVLEAMARGLPVVVSDGPGNPDAVGEAGMVVSYGDPAELAAALARLAGDPGLRARLGAAAQERVRDRFSAERMIEETRGVYERALADAA